MSFDMSWIDSSVSGSVASQSAWVVGDDWLYQDYSVFDSDVVDDDDNDDLGWVVGEPTVTCWDPAVNHRYVRVIDKSWKEFDIPF